MIITLFPELAGCGPATVGGTQLNGVAPLHLDRYTNMQKRDTDQNLFLILNLADQE